MRNLLLCLVVLCATQVHANKMESWYTYWGLGYADVGYPDEVDTMLDQLAELPGIDHFSIALDGLGFYWPADTRRLYGFIINGFGDRYEEDTANWMQLNGYLISASTMSFFDEIGAGPFVRLDAGLAKYVVNAEIGGYDDSESSDWGVGALAGGGYALPVFDGTRILLNLNYAVRRIAGENTTTLGISVGGLF